MHFEQQLPQQLPGAVQRLTQPLPAPHAAPSLLAALFRPAGPSFAGGCPRLGSAESRSSVSGLGIETEGHCLVSSRCPVLLAAVSFFVLHAVHKVPSW